LLRRKFHEQLTLSIPIASMEASTNRSTGCWRHSWTYF